ncbi:MAG: hypothetical protein OEM96_10725 [Gemmatimonadota bacterium]|nr:hypothetical protein [Gemmatimonadota bacterium]
MNEPAPPTVAGSVRSLPLAIAVVLGTAGARLLSIGTPTSVSAGVLLMAGALGGAAVGLGSKPFGTAVEGPIDLSTRIGLGLLGGLLAGLLHGVMTDAAGWLGIASALRAGIDVDLSASEWWNRAISGGMLGLVLGLVWTWLPGGGAAKRGAAFGLLLAVWQLFFVYPFRLNLGVAGIEAGLGVVPLVLVGLIVSGAVAGRVIAWGGGTDLAPVSAPLVE